MRVITAMTVALLLSGCAEGLGLAPASSNAGMVQGPPIEDVVTPFDEALTCLRANINPSVVFAVGAIADLTGRETYTDGGTGKFVTQGAADMVQSALFRAGVSVVNRRNMDIPINEVRWGIRQLDRQVRARYFVSGSINSLDFVPGGGASMQVAGVGPRYRQNRILVGIDLSLTDADTGRIVANVPLQKQIFAAEIGFSAGRFFGPTLLTLDAGGMQREAMNFALRHMLSLATFELLAQRMEPRHFLPCRARLDPVSGMISASGTGLVEQKVREALEGLRETDPRRALILERELAGETIEDIVADLDAAPAASGAEAAPAPADPDPLDAPSADWVASGPDAVAAPAPLIERTDMPRRPTALDGAGQPLSLAPVAPVPPAALTESAPEAPAAAPPGSAAAERARTGDDRPSSPPPAATGSVTYRIGEAGDVTRVEIDGTGIGELRWGIVGRALVVVMVDGPGPFEFQGPLGRAPATRIAGARQYGAARMQALQLDLTCDCGARRIDLGGGRIAFEIEEGAPKPQLRAEAPADPGAAPARRPHDIPPTRVARGPAHEIGA